MELLIQVSEHGSHHSSQMIALGLGSKPSFYTFMCQDDLRNFNDCSTVVAASRFLRQVMCMPTFPSFLHKTLGTRSTVFTRWQTETAST